MAPDQVHDQQGQEQHPLRAATPEHQKVQEVREEERGGEINIIKMKIKKIINKNVLKIQKT